MAIDLFPLLQSVESAETLEESSVALLRGLVELLEAGHSSSDLANALTSQALDPDDGKKRSWELMLAKMLHRNTSHIPCDARDEKKRAVIWASIQTHNLDKAERIVDLENELATKITDLVVANNEISTLKDANTRLDAAYKQLQASATEMAKQMLVMERAILEKSAQHAAMLEIAQTAAAAAERAAEAVGKAAAMERSSTRAAHAALKEAKATLEETKGG